MNHHERYLMWALIASAAILSLSLGGRALWDPDEGRYAEMAREILVLHDWVTPHLNFLLYFEKPMLFMWLEALSFKIFGVSESSAHVIPLVSALGGVALVGLMAWKLWGRRAGLVASLSLITSLEYFFLASAVDINMPLALFITSALVFFWLGHREKNSLYILLSWASMALATLTKGPIGVILPLGSICIYILLSRQFSLIKKSRPVSGILLLLAIASPWFILVSIKNPDFFSFFFINQNLERYTSSSERYQPFFYFVPVILGGALPWTFLLPSAIKEIWQNKIPREVLYIFVWFSLIFLFFTPSHSKLATYVLPCFPPLSLLLGYACKGSPKKGGLPLNLTGILWLCMGVLLILFPVLQTHGIVHISSEGAIPLVHIGTTAGAILIFATLIGIWLGRKYDNALGLAMMGMVIMILAITFAPKWDSLRSTKSLVQDLPSSAKLYAYRGYGQSSSFYSQRQVGLVESVGELEFGIKHNREKGVVITADELAASMKTDKNVYCLTDKDNLPNLRKTMPSIAIVKQTNDLCLLHIPGP